MTTPEGKIKTKVNRALKTLPKCWRFMPVQMGMGAPALDYLLCINGFFVAIETKTPGKWLTARQQTTADKMKAAGAKVFVIWDDESLAFCMAYLRGLCQ